MTAAYLHILGDLLLSVGVVISSAVIWWFPVKEFPWSKYFDPACTLIFSVIICYTCKATLYNSIFILMEGTPDAIDIHAIEEELKKLDDVAEVKEVHCWSLSRGKNVFVAKIIATHDPQSVLKKATDTVKEFGVENITIQVQDKAEAESAAGDGHGHGHSHGHGHGHAH